MALSKQIEEETAKLQDTSEEVAKLREELEAAQEALFQLRQENPLAVTKFKKEPGYTYFYSKYEGSVHYMPNGMQSISFQKLFSDRLPCYKTKDRDMIEYLKSQKFQYE